MLSTKCWQAVYLGNQILCLWQACSWWSESQMDGRHFHTKPLRSWKVFSAAASKLFPARDLMFMSWSIIHSYKGSSLLMAQVRIANQSIKKLWRKQSILLKYHRSLRRLCLRKQQLNLKALRNTVQTLGNRRNVHLYKMTWVTGLLKSRDMNVLQNRVTVQAVIKTLGY